MLITGHIGLIADKEHVSHTDTLMVCSLQLPLTDGSGLGRTTNGGTGHLAQERCREKGGLGDHDIILRRKNSLNPCLIYSDDNTHGRFIRAQSPSAAVFLGFFCLPLMKQKQEQHGHWNKNFISLSLSIDCWSLPPRPSLSGEAHHSGINTRRPFAKGDAAMEEIENNFVSSTLCFVPRLPLG